MKIDPVKKAPVPAISGEDLVATVPEVSKYAKVEVENISNVPSDYMDPPRWITLTNGVSAAAGCGAIARATTRGAAGRIRIDRHDNIAAPFRRCRGPGHAHAGDGGDQGR